MSEGQAFETRESRTEPIAKADQIPSDAAQSGGYGAPPMGRKVIEELQRRQETGDAIGDLGIPGTSYEVLKELLAVAIATARSQLVAGLEDVISLGSTYTSKLLGDGIETPDPLDDSNPRIDAEVPFP